MDFGRKEFRIALNKQTITVRMGDRRGQWITTVPDSTKRHYHSYCELQLLLKGRQMMELDGKSLVVEEKQGILIPPCFYHRTRTLTEEFERISLKLFFGNGDLNDRLLGISFHSFPVDESMEIACRTFVREYEEEDILREEMVQAQLASLIIQIMRKTGLFEKNKDEAKEDMTFRLDQIEEIDAYMKACYMKKAGMSELANRISVSIRQLRTMMKELYGMSFREKLISVRMEQAGILLRTTDMSTTEVADMVGYSSESSFYQNFRDYYAMTPGEYRKQREKDIHNPHMARISGFSRTDTKN